MKLRMTLMLGGVVVALSALALEACSSSGGSGSDGGSGGSGGSTGSGSGGSTGTGTGGSTGTGTGGTTGTGTGGTTGTGTGGSTGSGSGGASGSGSDGGVDCGTAATLHAETPDGGLYCPFSAVDGGKTIYCARPSDVCCAPKYSGSPVPPSVCVKEGTACPVSGSYIYECEGPLDCAGSSKGKVCCAAGTAQKEAPMCPNYNYTSGNTIGTVCETACAAGENIVCDLPTGECPSGKTCTPVKLHGSQVGYCM